MVPSRLCIGAALALAALASPALGQNPHNIRIDPAGESTRAFLSYTDSAAEALLARLYETPKYLDYKPFAMLLTNASGQAIVLVTVRWSGMSGNKTVVMNYSCHSLMRDVPGGSGVGGGTMFDPRNPEVMQGGGHMAADGPVVLGPGERMIVAPGLMAREAYVRRYGRTNASSWSSSMASFGSAAEISVSLDLVVLEDGSVYGPDNSHTIDGLLAQKAAMDFVVGYVRAAEQKGIDGVEALRMLANTAMGSVGPDARRHGQIARMLKSSRDWKQQLAKMAAFQLPRFQRK